MQYRIHILFLVFTLLVCSCNNEQEQKEFDRLKEKYGMLPFTDIERQAHGLDSLFTTYDSLKKPLLTFITRYGSEENTEEVNTWLHRIESREEYWRILRAEFNSRARPEALRPRTPEQFCSIQRVLDSLRHTLQYKEPVVLDVFTHELDAIERSILSDKEVILESYLKAGSSTIRTNMRRKVEEFINRTEKDSRILTINESSSVANTSDTTLTLDVTYTVSLTRKILVFINKTKDIRVKATVSVPLDCGKRRAPNYSIARVGL